MTELHRKRDFAAQLREEATGPWAEDYLALAELEDAKADVIEAQLNARLSKAAGGAAAPEGVIEARPL